MVALTPPDGTRPAGGKIPALALVRIFGPSNARKMGKPLAHAAQEEEWHRQGLELDGEAHLPMNRARVLISGPAD